jgi:hypothetical protein
MSKKRAGLVSILTLVLGGSAVTWYRGADRLPGGPTAATPVDRRLPRLLPARGSTSNAMLNLVPHNQGRPAPTGFQTLLDSLLAEGVLRKVGPLASIEAVQSFLQHTKAQAARSPAGNLALIEGLAAIRMLRSERDPEFLHALELEFVADMGRFSMQHQTTAPGEPGLGPDLGRYFRTAREDQSAPIALAGIARDYLREISQYVPLPAPGDE